MLAILRAMPSTAGKGERGWRYDKGKLISSDLIDVPQKPREDVLIAIDVNGIKLFCVLSLIIS